jgi:transposase InsO family protein
MGSLDARIGSLDIVPARELCRLRPVRSRAIHPGIQSSLVCGGVRDEPQGYQGARPANSRQAARARRRGDRMTRPMAAVGIHRRCRQPADTSAIEGRPAVPLWRRVFQIGPEPTFGRIEIPHSPLGRNRDIRSDNGPEFVAKAVQEWIAAVDTKTAYIERGSPWENGYIESFNARLRDELLNGETSTLSARPEWSSRAGGSIRRDRWVLRSGERRRGEGRK